RGDHARQLALVDAGKQPEARPGAKIRLESAASPAALYHPDGSPGKSVLYHPVLLYHHHLEQWPGRVHGHIGRRSADFPGRSAVLQMAGPAPLGLPGVSCADLVRRAADGAADHFPPVDTAELPLLAGYRCAAGVTQPPRTVSGMELEKPGCCSVIGARRRPSWLDG